MRPRIVFLGSPEPAVRALEAARDVGDVVAVLSRPDRPAGRGRKPKPPPVALAARTMGIPLHQPDTIRTEAARSLLASFSPDVMLVVAYGRILPPSVLAVPPRGCVNVHFSLLPRHRGAAPAARAILAGDAETGVSLMLLDEGMDTGPVIASRRTRIGADETAGDLTDRLAGIGAAMIREDLPRYVSGEIAPSPQPVEGATSAPKIEKSEGLISWGLGAADVHRRIRAMNPSPGAYTFHSGLRLRMHRARLLAHVPSPGPGAVRVEGRRLAVGCADACVEIVEIQRDGGKRLDAASFLAGHPLAEGSRFEEGGPS